MRDKPIYTNGEKDRILYFLDYGKSIGGASEYSVTAGAFNEACRL